MSCSYISLCKGTSMGGLSVGVIYRGVRVLKIVSSCYRNYHWEEMRCTYGADGYGCRRV